jgi:hypothetical protein
MLRRVVWKELTDVSDVVTASIIRAMMEYSHFHTRHRENLNSHFYFYFVALFL